MLDKIHTQHQEFLGHHPLLDSWLNARQELLVDYMHLAGLNPKRHTTAIDNNELQTFCDKLVDYVSIGHFEVYNYIFQAFENASGTSLKTAQSLYPKLRVTTDLILDFNDKYSDPNDEILGKVDDDLNKLGPVFELRFELEDKMLKTLKVVEFICNFAPEQTTTKQASQS